MKWSRKLYFKIFFKCVIYFKNQIRNFIYKYTLKTKLEHNKNKMPLNFLELLQHFWNKNVFEYYQIVA